MSEPRDPPHDLETTPSEQELRDAASLREALDAPSSGGEAADLARALRAAWSPKDLPAAQHRALVERALARSPRRVVRVSFAASAFVALAASILLVLRGTGPGATTPTLPPVALSRSTQSLFSQAFPATGGETARIDRIAMARGADLRDNEFAKWGLR